MSKRIDPVDRAIDAWIALDETQRARFETATKYIVRGRTQQPAPRIGRPPGSRNVAKPNGAEAATGTEVRG
jgi:hypothetical protein